ncbi:unnamed protein product [Effrenium voratum]|nr:unnamed protein product [Effrenium voratum]
MPPAHPTLPARTLERMARQDHCALRCAASFPDLTWTKKRSPKVPQDPPRRFQGPRHLQDYAGHVPLKFDPFAGKHVLQKSASLPQIKAKSGTATSDGFGMWYGHVGNFPSPVDNWAPAHFVDGNA